MTIPDYEAMLETYYRSILKPGDVCVDVGAHLGRHALPMAQCVGRVGRVHAFEPIPAINQRLREKIAGERWSSGLADIVVYDAALSDRSGTADFIVVVEFPEYSGLRERVYDHEVTKQHIEVPMRRMDEMLASLERLDYIKIDAEGGEFPILRGAESLVRSFRPVITFESGDNGLVNYEHTSGDIFDLFAAWGYRIEDLTRRPLDRAAYVESSARQAIWDYIALPQAD